MAIASRNADHFGVFFRGDDPNMVTRSAKATPGWFSRRLDANRKLWLHSNVAVRIELPETNSGPKRREETAGIRSTNRFLWGRRCGRRTPWSGRRRKIEPYDRVRLQSARRI